MSNPEDTTNSTASERDEANDPGDPGDPGDTEVAFVVRLLERSFDEIEPFAALRESFEHRLSNATNETLERIRDAVADIAAAVLFNNPEGLQLAELFRYQQLGLSGEQARICRALEMVEAAIRWHKSPARNVEVAWNGRALTPLRKGSAAVERNAAGFLIRELGFLDPCFGKLKSATVVVLLNTATKNRDGGKHRRASPGVLAVLMASTRAFGVITKPEAASKIKRARQKLSAPKRVAKRAKKTARKP